MGKIRRKHRFRKETLDIFWALLPYLKGGRCRFRIAYDASSILDEALWGEKRIAIPIAILKDIRELRKYDMIKIASKDLSTYSQSMSLGWRGYRLMTSGTTKRKKKRKVNTVKQYYLPPVNLLNSL